MQKELKKKSSALERLKRKTKISEEAHAREAQIEAALERVRSRTMAMQRSEELSAVAALLFQQVKSFGLESWTCGIMIHEKDDKVGTCYLTDKDGNIFAQFRAPLVTKDPLINRFYESKQNGEDFWFRETGGKELVQHYEYLCTVPVQGEFLKGLLAAGIPFPTFQVTHAVNFLQGSLIFITNEPVPEVHDIFKRFAKVFQQTYTRFLDLQKAEAQAREGQIQLAMERVRARTMAMQRSEELPDAALLLSNQVKEVGVQLWGTSFQLWAEDRNEITVWACIKDKIIPSFKVPTTGDLLYINILEAGRKGDALYVEELGGEALENHLNYMMSIPAFREGFVSVLDKGVILPVSNIFHAAYFSNGFILFITTESVPEAHDIFKRFAKVFEQTYTRFLDLQKAEAQAREAQIEVALERVRSRTMAMHKSEELAETAAVLFKQLSDLGNEPVRISIGIPDEASGMVDFWVTDRSGEQVKINYRGRLDEPTSISKIFEGLKTNHKSLIIDLQGKEFENWNRYCREEMGVINKIEELKNRRLQNVAFFTHGWLNMSTNEPASIETINLLERFATVFNLTFTRFLDLQKAEAQATESQIQLALERVRARTMAMQRSDELSETAYILFQQFKELGEDPIQITIGIFNEDERVIEFSITGLDGSGSKIDQAFNMSMEEPTLLHKIYTAWKEQKKSTVIELGGPELLDWITYRNKVAGSSDTDAKINLNYRRVVSVGFFSKGLISISKPDAISEETTRILERFAGVFNLTYTRFLDLKKAEAQAREAQIELGLERVRAKAMAMQTSEELNALIGTVFKELTILDLVLTRCVIMIYDAATKGVKWWMANSEAPSAPMNFFVKYHELPFFHACLKGWNERTIKWQYILEGTAKKELDDFVFTETELSLLPDFVIAGMRAPDRVYLNASFNNFGNLLLASLEPLSDEHFDILLRFAKVFDLTYTRFNDLQQAEAQTREAKIEAALEKVRSRTMAMQRSAELAEVATVLFQQVKVLGVPQWTCGFSIFEIDDKEFTWYPGSADGEILPPIKIPLTEHPVFISFNESRKRGDEFFVYEKEGEFQTDHYRYMRSLPGGEEMNQNTLKAGLTFPAFQIDHIANFSHGNLVFITYEHFPEMHDVFKRFAKVFEQTYTRFLDLQKAEAQAKEATIEASLERVRSRSMGMQKSEELREIIQVIYEQFIQLGIKIDSAGFATDYMESDDFNFWFADSYSTFPKKVYVPYFNHPQFNRFKEAKEKGLDFYASKLTFEEKNKFFDHVLKNAPPIPQELKEVFYSAPGYISSHVVLKNIVLYILNYTDIPFSDAENATLMRFGKVFEQAYTRFNDLKQAEAQALEAIKRASVDRVRAEIASMRTTNDLERITPLIWNELITLGVPFIRCGVFIMDEQQQQVHTFLSTPEGKAIATLHVPFEFNLSIIINGVDHWRKREVYKEHWDAATFTTAWIKLSSLRETSMDSSQNEKPPENLYLHLLPFLQGMLYVGNDAPLNDDELQLVQNLADAFSTAYARYEDFNKLESANVKIEKTLVDLKQTQAQLVQSEKMASLGELTAGIAHEIQNPLNFVNNFSEVNRELIQELKNEILSDDKEEAISIANDIDNNEEKISHHGKRADAIVKGMLQHSRSSSGVKEPTDINALADEYLRLSFHGLRAKDTSFNATMKTDFDESIGKINIIPQDIGRVLLNLYNNAFYAVTDKKKHQPEGYEPTVSVTTKKIADKIEVRVKDNGNGIPQKVVDKIFQPFFTTKPTGEGTGLGLSLSYDIVKAHGGEIKVETKEGEETEFIIQLPISSKQ